MRRVGVGGGVSLGEKQSQKLLRKKSGKRQIQEIRSRKRESQSDENIQQYILFIQHSSTEDTTSGGRREKSGSPLRPDPRDT